MTMQFIIIPSEEDEIGEGFQKYLNALLLKIVKDIEDQEILKTNITEIDLLFLLLNSKLNSEFITSLSIAETAFFDPDSVSFEVDNISRYSEYIEDTDPDKNNVRELLDSNNKSLLNIANHMITACYIDSNYFILFNLIMNHLYSNYSSLFNNS
jgi:hypothetical protein